MDMDRATECIRWVIEVIEGGYSDDPKDTGGRTIYGIAEAHHPEAWRDGPPSKADAVAIYRQQYWDACRCDDLPTGMDLAVYDASVNHGVSRAVRWLQQACGAHVDGVFGPETERRVWAAGSDGLVAFQQIRARFYPTCRTWETHRNGWLNRLVKVTVRASWEFHCTEPEIVAVKEESSMETKKAHWVSEMIRDHAGQISSLRVVYIGWCAIMAGVWGWTSLQAGAMQPMPEEAVWLIGALTGGKAVQKFAER